MFIVVKGSCSLTLHGQRLNSTSSPSWLGGVGILDGSARRSGAVAVCDDTILAIIDRACLYEKLPPQLSVTLLKAIASSVNSLLTGAAVYRNIDVLLVQDGGCSPGYDAVK